jgi:hypothetical protein
MVESLGQLAKDYPGHSCETNDNDSDTSMQTLADYVYVHMSGTEKQ